MSKPNSFKLVLLGESAVGKSSLVLRFVRDEFSDFRESTIGAAFLTQNLTLEDGTVIKFEIWDTAGQERYRSLAPIYFRNSAAAVVVYDITQSPDQSFSRAKTWIQTLRQQSPPSLIIYLVGNKADICSTPETAHLRRVEREVAEKYAKEEGVMWGEVSAKTGEGVGGVFESVAKALPLPAPSSTGASGAAGARSGVNLSGGKAAEGVKDACNC